jgi:RNA polymerase sigma-54 factor
MSRPSLELRPGQQLTLTPQLQQSIRLLQLSTLDLEMEISQALSDNPLLEREDDGMYEDSGAGEEPKASESSDTDFAASSEAAPASEGEYGGDGETDFSNYSSSGGNFDDDDGAPETARAETLREHLIGQLMLTRASHRDRVLTELLIDELDENGYLGSSLTEVLSWLPEDAEADEDELRAALVLLQSFEPTGVGAADMAECLLLQLRYPDPSRLPESVLPGVLACARELCAHHLPLLAGGNVARLREAVRCDDATIRLARALILRLDPRPGRLWTVPAAEYAVPDVIVRKTRKGWQVSLNSAAMPKLRINSLYAQMLGNQRQSSHAGLHSQLQQARWMIRNVEQRFDTILRVSQAIVDRQQAFFTKGMSAMRPLILKVIATELGLHESTISRATTQKYMLTPFGTFELKRFFGAGVATDTGDEASATAVQAFIRQLVADENRSKPLSDNQLSKKLAEQGIVIARRTVAKYRETLRISPASQRKSHTLLNK